MQEMGNTVAGGTRSLNGDLVAVLVKHGQDMTNTVSKQKQTISKQEVQMKKMTKGISKHENWFKEVADEISRERTEMREEIKAELPRGDQG